MLPYIYVDHLDDVLRARDRARRRIVTPPHPEGDLWIATIHDPAGNTIGIWQQGPR